MNVIIFIVFEYLNVKINLKSILEVD